MANEIFQDDGEPPSDRSEEPACPIERLVKELKGKSARERYTFHTLISILIN